MHPVDREYGLSFAHVPINDFFIAGVKKLSKPLCLNDLIIRRPLQRRTVTYSVTNNKRSILIT